MGPHVLKVAPTVSSYHAWRTTRGTSPNRSIFRDEQKVAPLGGGTDPSSFLAVMLQNVAAYDCKDTISGAREP